MREIWYGDIQLYEDGSGWCVGSTDESDEEIYQFKAEETYADILPKLPKGFALSLEDFQHIQSELKNLEEEHIDRAVYFYGMRLRGYAPSCQPKGNCCRLDDPKGKYHDIIGYKEKLSEQDVWNYELDYLGVAENHSEFEYLKGVHT